MKVLILKDSDEAMSNYYLEHEYTQDYKVSDLMAEEERKQLSRVHQFYKGCCIEFDEKESGEVEGIKVKKDSSLTFEVAFQVRSVHGCTTSCSENLHFRGTKFRQNLNFNHAGLESPDGPHLSLKFD